MYQAPLSSILDTLSHSVDWHALKNLPGCEDVSDDLVAAILEEAAKLSADVLSPLNWTGDQDGTILNDDGSITTAKGFKEAYAQYRDAGWNSLPFPTNHGGQGLPWALSMAVNEMWQSANVSFGLCPLLNQGAVDAIEAYASDALKEQFLPKMISGEWTGTMNLTEPQAGSDLGQIKTKAIKQNDHYLISGQKIYITFGEHDMADNIIHLVLARAVDAPSGVKGISLFIVPKILDDGSVNDVVCTGIEHKLGIHASPTCTMQFGDKDGAIGYLIGEENQGLVYMFKMMNNARLHVGVQGLGIAEMAYQRALHFTKERKQGTPLNGNADATIIEHPDVARMLLTMKSQIEAQRCLAYYAGSQMDFMARDPDKDSRDKAHYMCNLLTPIVKSCATDLGNEAAAMGVQIHGGMGFVEETGAAQYIRDARILTIYEGTNGIQAKDLVFRKILKEQAPALKPLLDDLLQLSQTMKDDYPKESHALIHGANMVAKAIDFIAKLAEDKKFEHCEASSYALMTLMGTVFAQGLFCKKIWGMRQSDAVHLKQQEALLSFYTDHIASKINGYYESVFNAESVINAAKTVFED